MTHESFYSKCNHESQTITLIKNEKGNIFGGFASLPWNNDNKEIDHFNDNKAFLFSLTNIYDSKPTKFPSGGGYEIRNYKGCGPAFGGGTDLGVHGNNIVKSGWSWFPHSFKDTLGKGNTIFTGNLEKNNIDFKIEEVEVFKAIANE